MDKEVLQRRLDELCGKAMADATAAVEQAPDGNWIAASEWQVREIFQNLTRDCYQIMLQAKADAHPASKQAAFSPGAFSSGDVAEQRIAPPPRAHRRR